MNKKINQELEELSPLLRQLSGQGDGLEVPYGYFENFDDKLRQRMTERGVRRHTLQQIHVPVKRRVWPGVLAAAASLALVLGAVRYFKTDSDTTQFAANDLTSEEITAFLMENAADFEPEQLATLEDGPNENKIPVTSPNETTSPGKDEIPAEAVEEIIDEMTDEELAELL